ncbi:MAG: TonB-dependent receptor [Saprospiraceae bacterium]|nr:TonB-dependent receptor [Saprospiraceae bacterium]
MKYHLTKILFATLLVHLTNVAFAQHKITLSGYIENADSREKLIGATVYDLTNKVGTVSNTYGFYSLTLPQRDSMTITISYVGYEKMNLTFHTKKDTIINIQLSESVQLKEVEIIAQKQADKIHEEVQMSKIVVPIEQIKRIPALFGEVDVLKSLQLLPGVQSGGEGQNGLYVRGGSPDQNLILLDGVPVYNVSHLLGFFSVFNADAIKNVTLTKGGFPARYGGRLSSVIDINMKEGNMQEYKGEASLGIISSKLTFEGPIKKNVASFIISGRRTYVDLLVKPFISAVSEGVDNNIKTDPTLFFYDLNAKVNYKINNKHRLYLSTYTGDDVFGIKVTENSTNDYYKVNSGTNWGNRTLAFRWNYMITNKLFANFTTTYSKYGFKFFSEFEEKYDTTTSNFAAKYFSGIRDWSQKIDFDYVPNPQHFIRFGGNITNHSYNPGAYQINVGLSGYNLDTLLGSKPIRSTESYLYIEDEINLGRLKANVGLHASGFSVGDVFYKSLQPRIGLNYLINNNLAVKASYCNMTQYINLLTNESISLPTDLWVPSTELIKPQQAWQTAIGVAQTWDDAFEVSIEAYYKSMKNVLSYKEGSNFLGLENDWQDKVTQGNGSAYGIEFFIQKKIGKLTGWVGYTWSRNWRIFESINSGNKYPFKYDRRHDVKLTASYEIKPNIVFSASWVYGTGNAITLPISSYTIPTSIPDNSIDGIQYANFFEVNSVGNKNDFRMAPYHRLDINFDFIKKKKRIERRWSIGAYNTYSRRNPYFLYSTTDYDAATRTYKKVFKQVSLFPIIPSISYGLKF